MSKAVMLAIRPEWCAKIVYGEKGVEARTRLPSIPTPFKCYIYCTSVNSLPLEKYVKLHALTGGKIDVWPGKVIGEFTCDLKVALVGYPDALAHHPLFYTYAIEKACLDQQTVQAYSHGKNLGGLHIVDLKVYDTPKKLSDFRRACNHKEDCCTCKRWDAKRYDCIAGLSHPPQSWCYVEDLEVLECD